MVVLKAYVYTEFVNPNILYLETAISMYDWLQINNGVALHACVSLVDVLKGIQEFKYYICDTRNIFVAHYLRYGFSNLQSV